MQTTEEKQWFKDAITVDYDESLSKALAALQKSKTCVIITKDGKYHGVLDDRHIRQMGANPSTERAGTEAIRAPTITTNMDPLEIAKLFFTGHYKALPIVQKNKVLGIIAKADILRLLLENGLIKKGRVNEIMSYPPLYIEENASIIQARSLMRTSNVKRLIVTKNGLFIGIISTYDLGRLSGRKEKPLIMQDKASYSNQPVSSFMRSDILTVEPNETIAASAKIMADNNVSALIVTDQNKPVGVLSATDILETVLVGTSENVWIVGLIDEDKEFAQDIKDLCSKTLGKIKGSFRVESLTLHVKKYGRKYSIRARANHGTVTSISTYGWELKETVRKALAEIKKVLERSKPNKMHIRQGMEEE